MEENVKSKAIINFVWRFAERIGAQLVSFVVSVILARMLLPEAYGTIALVMVFITILRVFIDSGLGVALIQKKDADELDFSSVFYFNIVICVVLYIVMYFMAPVLADFYDKEIMLPLIRVISLVLIISGVKNIQQAYVSRNLMFKRFFFSTLGGTLFSAFLGIIMAWRGWGVWALVAQQLSNDAIDTLILWVTVRWRPQKAFSWKRLQSLLSFGWKLLVSSLLDAFYDNIRSLVIGKSYSVTDLAYYNKGQQFPNLIFSNIHASVNSVLLPVMSKAQDEKERVKAMTRKSMRMLAYAMWPLLAGLAICAETLITLLLTDKWLPCVPYIRLFCLVFVFHPVHIANLNAMRAMGEGSAFLRTEAIKKTVDLVILLVTMNYGVYAMAFGVLLITPVSAWVSAYPNRNILAYPFGEQMRDLLPYMAATGIMSISIQILKIFPLYGIYMIFIQVIVGLIVYLITSILFRLEILGDLFEVLQRVIKRRR